MRFLALALLLPIGALLALRPPVADADETRSAPPVEAVRPAETAPRPSAGRAPRPRDPAPDRELAAREVKARREVARTRPLGGRALGDALRRLAWVRGRRGDVAEAAHLLEAALALPHPPAETPDVLVALGLVRAQAGRLTAAREAFTRAYAAARAAGRTRTAAAALHGLGGLALRETSPAAARALLEEALALRRAAGDRAGEAATLADLSTACRTLGDTARAEVCARDALALATAGGDTVAAARARVRLAEALQDRGLPAEAFPLLDAALDVLSAAGDAAGLVEGHTALGTLHLDRGETGEALAAFTSALDEARALGERTTLVRALANVALARHAAQDPGGASAHLDEALRLLPEGEAPRLHAALALDRGALLLGEGDAVAAAAAFEHALAAARAHGAQDTTMHALLGLGAARLDRGDLAGARAPLEEALALARHRGRDRAAAVALGDLGLLAQRRGAPATARDRYVEAVRRADRAGATRAGVLARWGLAHAHAVLGEPARALAVAREALRASTALPLALDDVLRPGAREADAGLMDLALRAALAEGDPATVFAVAETTRAAGLRQSLEAGTRTVDAPAHARTQAEEAARRREGAARAALEAARRAGLVLPARRRRDDLAHARREVIEVVARAQRLSRREARLDGERREARLDGERREAREDVPGFVADTAAVRARLPADAALVAYVLLDEEAFAVVVAADGERLLALGAAAPVRAACTAAAARTPAEDPEPAWSALRARLVTPLALPARVRRVFVVPDGPLAGVPFGRLAPGRAVVLVPSAGAWLALDGTTGRRGRGILAFGDPASKTGAHTARGLGLGRLPSSAGEARAVGEEVHVGTAATESAFVARATARERWRAVHLACHALVDAEQPWLSSLVLGGDDAHDGHLTALDIGTLRVPADLVVLAGCGTARGRAYRAEGTVGLPSAFLAAGARSVLASLWKVDDAATRALMERFYALWHPADGGAALPAAEALSAAQAHVRAHERWRHPHYWAAWVLWGSPDADEHH